MIQFVKSGLLFFMLCIIACTSQNDLFVSFSNDEISYSGRIDTSRIEAAELYWPGTSIKINFEGESINAVLADERGDNYYNVILDDDSVFILRPTSTKSSYRLASNLSKGAHKIEIFKRTGWSRGKTQFYGFEISGNSKILDKSAPKKRKIEFYGNSITVGYAVEDLSGNDSPDSTYTNNYISYAPITARHFDAEYQCICKSGIGITVSWFPMIMPEMYSRLIPQDPNSRWDFSLYTPDVVVVNLFQNDSWIVNMPDNDQFKNRFGKEAPDDDFIVDSYARFIGSIRAEYPDAVVIAMLGSMDATKEDSIWPDYIERALEELNDPKIYTHFVPYKGTPGHPTLEEQREIANSLIQFIEDNIQW